MKTVESLCSVPTEAVGGKMEARKRLNRKQDLTLAQLWPSNIVRGALIFRQSNVHGEADGGGRVGPKRHNTMSDDLKFQLRLTLSDKFAQVARRDLENSSTSDLTDILNRHDAKMKCQPRRRRMASINFISMNGRRRRSRIQPRRQNTLRAPRKIAASPELCESDA